MPTETNVAASVSKRTKKNSEITPLRLIAGILFIIFTVWGTAYAFHVSDSQMYIPIGVSAIVFLALGCIFLFDGL